MVAPIHSSTHAADRPIGVFDSGVGGLTVVYAMRRLLPAESVLYLGDMARLPYGNKSPETIVRYAREIVAYLRGKEVKAIVVACNTASSHALAALRAETDLPVIGVIEPGVQAALAATRNRRIGVIGTQGTIRSETYQRQLRALAPDLFILARPAPLLAALVEEDWLEHSATEQILAEYLAPMIKAEVDTVVLACTHYPLLKPLAQRLLGPGVVLVDSAENTAVALQGQLRAAGLERAPENGPGKVTVCTTDAPAQFVGLAERFLGEKIAEIHQVAVG